VLYTTKCLLLIGFMATFRALKFLVLVGCIVGCILWCSNLLPKTVAFVGAKGPNGMRVLLMTKRTWNKLHPFYTGKGIAEIKNLITTQTGGLLDAKILGEPVITGKKSGMTILLFEVPFLPLQKLYAALKAKCVERGREFVWITAGDLKNGRIPCGAAQKNVPIFAARMMSGEVRDWLESRTK
jgi:hypothetical protein